MIKVRSKWREEEEEEEKIKSVCFNAEVFVTGFQLLTHHQKN